MTVNLLDRAIYSYADVDRLIGLRAGTARRWLEGYRRGGRFYQPVLRAEPTDSNAVTWGEMVESRLLAEFRDREVPVQRLRPAVERLRAEFGPYPLAHAAPFLDVEGRELVRFVQEDVGLEQQLRLVVVRNGQTVLTATTERFRELVEYDDGAAVRLVPNPQTPEVAMDPALTFGQPAIRGVPTAILAEGYRAGASREELAELYELSPAQLEAAIRYEFIAGTARAA